jgi:hypothetical protein
MTTTTTVVVSSSYQQPTLILPCNVVKVCEEILEMIKECDTAIDNLTVQGVIDDQLSNKFTTLSYRLKNIGMRAINVEAQIQYFIQISCNKLHEYRQFYTAMGGKEPSVIYDSKCPPLITVTNKSIYYIEGSVDNIGFIPSIPLQQQDNNTTTKTTTTTKKGRSKTKYITMDNTEDNYHLSQLVNNNNNNNNSNTINTNAVETHTQKMNDFTISLREYMIRYENLKKDITLNNDIDNLLSYKDSILLDPLLINQTTIVGDLSIFNCSGPLNQIIQIIETEKTNLKEYVMNVVQRSKLCREYYDTHHNQNNNNNNNTNGRKQQFITSIYTKL